MALLLLLGLLGACPRDAGIEVLLAVSNAPPEVKALLVTGQLGGQAAMEPAEFTSNLARIRLLLQPETLSGRLELTIYGLDGPRGDGGCILASGGATLQIDGKGPFESSAGLLRLPQRRCDLQGPLPDLRGPELDMRAPGPAWTNGMAAVGSLTAANAGGLSQPWDACWNGKHLFVSDTGKHRVLVFDSVGDQVPATGVIGSASLMTPGTGQDPPDNASLNAPRGLWCDQRRLFVADSGNSRVVFYDLRSLPPGGAIAEGLAGQATAGTGQPNRGLPDPAANSLKFPYGVFVDGTRLFIADRGNNRVVGYQVPDFANLQSVDAKILLGQKGFQSLDPGSGDAGLSSPVGVLLDAGRLAVADKNNSRVTIYDKPSGTDNRANAALGQSSIGGEGAGHTAITLNLPGAVRVFGGQTFVADTANSRVLIYDQGLPAPGMFGSAARYVLGRAQLDDPPPPKMSGAADLYSPAGLFVAQVGGQTVLIVADTGNDRVQLFKMQ